MGYIQEIFSSFQGEGAAVEGSCYGLRQIFLRFAGCPIAQGIHGTKGCVWCDSPLAWSSNPEKCLVESQAGNQSFEEKNNPLTSEEVLDIVKKLETKDLHSISLTGGEPLYQPKFLEDIIEKLRENDYQIFLETAYTNKLGFLKRIANKIDFACVDIKDRSADASAQWETLVKEEIQMCKILKEAGTKIFAKCVITSSSRREDFEIIAKLCGEVNIPLIIQLVTPKLDSGIAQPSWRQIQEFTGIAATYLPSDKIGISVQMHKFINIL
ncbi:MAG: 7-carboxy-7-deazaguanine synthase QueE [Candidatus Thorarchaeota archaeon]